MEEPATTENAETFGALFLLEPTGGDQCFRSVKIELQETRSSVSNLPDTMGFKIEKSNPNKHNSNTIGLFREI